MEEKDSILVRNFNQQIDENFVFSSVKKGLRESVTFRGVPNTTFFACIEPFLQELISKKKCLIVAKPNEPETIYGFILYEEIQGVFILHYLYVKQVFRKMGLANYLLKKAGYKPLSHCCYTFKTVATEQYLAKKMGAYYNPFIHMVDFTTETTPADLEKPEVVVEEKFV